MDYNTSYQDAPIFSVYNHCCSVPPPPSANHRAMNEHLSSCLDQVLMKHPSSGVILAGDFNKLPEWTLKQSYRLTQVVNSPTREKSILDKCFTNMTTFYDTPTILPHIGKSDHLSFAFTPKPMINYNKGGKETKLVRISGKNEKALFVNALTNTRWTEMYKLDTCKEQFEYFDNIMSGYIDNSFPYKTVTIHNKDKPWVTEKFKTLICDRQRALNSGDRPLYNKLRNRINRDNRNLRKRFYSEKIDSLTASDNKQWWKHIKYITGMSKSSSNQPMVSLANETSQGDLSKLAEQIIEFYTSVSQDLPPITEDNTYLQADVTLPIDFHISVDEVEKNFAKVKPGKAAGPDHIQAWMLRDLAPLLAPPLTAIFNSSLRDGYVPDKWKTANVCPIPKRNPPRSIKTDLRPISLTSLVGKELERFVIAKLNKSSLPKLGPEQYGNSKGVSTTHLIVELVDSWLQALETPGTSVRVLLLDYSKAFDRVNNITLMDKFAALDTPAYLTKWIASFLHNRQQCVKIGDHLSDLIHVKGATPQGAGISMGAFTVMIDDLRTPIPIYKYVDDTTLSEIIRKQQESMMQQSIDIALNWTKTNYMRINVSKTKKLIISFAKKRRYI